MPSTQIHVTEHIVKLYPGNQRPVSAFYVAQPRELILSFNTGVPSLPDLMPDDLRWSWLFCSTVYNTRNALTRPQTPPSSGPWRVLFRETCSWCQTGWEALFEHIYHHEIIKNNKYCNGLWERFCFSTCSKDFLSLSRGFPCWHKVYVPSIKSWEDGIYLMQRY